MVFVCLSRTMQALDDPGQHGNNQGAVDERKRPDEAGSECLRNVCLYCLSVGFIESKTTRGARPSSEHPIINGVNTIKPPTKAGMAWVRGMLWPTEMKLGEAHAKPIGPVRTGKGRRVARFVYYAANPGPLRELWHPTVALDTTLVITSSSLYPVATPASVTMWDVVWTDPEKESRREHRERKASKPACKDKSSSTPRSIFGRDSTSSSERPFPLSLNGLKPFAKNVASPAPPPSSTHESARAEYYDAESGRLSYDSIPHKLTGSATENMLLRGEFAEFTQDQIHMHDATGDHHLRQSSSSSSWSSTAPERVALEPCQIVQTLSEGSFVARSTQVTTSIRTSDELSSGLASEIIITANTDSPPKSSGTQSQLSMRRFGALSLPKPPPLPIAPRRVPSHSGSLRCDVADVWKPPATWACSPTTDTSFSTMEYHLEPNRSDASLSTELNAMQREVNRLTAESNIVRLLRLKEVWGRLSNPDLCKALEVEKVQWMLSALYNMDAPLEKRSGRGIAQDTTPAGLKRVLALYETPAVASYLAAVFHSKQLYHLSSSPLSHTLFPNIHPVLVPARSTSAFPVASSSFGSVYSLRLPISNPSQDIPGLLKNIHRCLEPDGALHLVLIDPLPVALTLGPLLRTWIEKHLLLNLETNFRCTKPTRLFPIWLENASFRVESVTAATRKFLAVPPLEENRLPATCQSEEDIKQELRNFVGRMLWMEVWAEYITSDTWWWEDPQIVDECKQLKTAWEWRLIKALKE
ncbi:hypothetical protein FZEAL_249 [Fusarium zealandicum]|uniref:Uncharacterized protein n=1 Tax=Fusarium zealandicum TaxID=1053134 RepID=A0A8H4UV25_9HYPO|nr:hypothetical protein FZEAL_249 [Fusarium zealandicum]